jgi:hypothetical protein
MAHTRLQQVVEESQFETQRLRERMSLAVQTVRKNLPLTGFRKRYISVVIEKGERRGKCNNNSFEARCESRTLSDRDKADTRQVHVRPTRQRVVDASKFQSANRTNTRNAQARAALRCHKCEGTGHFARECSTREQNYSRRRGKMKLAREGKSKRTL